MYNMITKCWPVAQLAVQKAVNFEVDGSSPSWPVFVQIKICLGNLMVEYLTCNEIAGVRFLS